MRLRFNQSMDSARYVEVKSTKLCNIAAEAEQHMRFDWVSMLYCKNADCALGNYWCGLPFKITIDKEWWLSSFATRDMSAALKLRFSATPWASKEAYLCQTVFNQLANQPLVEA
jgi:hypothetical protein